MSYGRLKSALDLFNSVEAARPDLVDKARLLKAHYLPDGSSKKPGSYYHLYVTLRLLMGDGHAQATSALGQAMQIHVLNAEKALMDAVNEGPAFLKDDEEFLHGKGIMRGRTKYFLSNRDIKAGTLYDRAWIAMDPVYRPIIGAAVEAALRREGIGLKTMKYVAASLMPDEMKCQELKTLSGQYGHEHSGLLKEALGFISVTAQQFEITLPPFMQTAADAAAKPVVQERKETPPVAPSFGKATENTAARLPSTPLPPAPVPDKGEPASVLRDNFVEKSVPVVPVQPEETPAEREMRLLKRDLATLRNNREISERERGVYMWLKLDENRTVHAAADLLTKNGDKKINANYVRLMIANVNFKLKSLRGEDSNSNLHQDHTLRPE